MTSRELLRLVLRRWYLMVLGAVVSLAAMSVVSHRPPLYWTQFHVVVLAPRNDLNPNSIEDPHYALAPMAGVMVSDLNHGNRPLLMGSPDTTLYGEGLRHGYRVRLPNVGSQWRPMYEPDIDVQVVDSTPEKVAEVSRHLRSELDATLERRQDALGVVPTMRMTTISSPDDPIIYPVGGNRNRAALAIALAGATLTTIAVYWLERWLQRRRRRRWATPTEAPRERELTNIS